MTREEAIERFNGIINAMSISVAQSKFYPSKAELNELCDMAIEALTYQNLSKPNNTCEVGLISRADAIDAIQNAYCKPCKERGDDHNEVRCRVCEYDNAIIQIDALPSADAVQGWIPFKRRPLTDEEQQEYPDWAYIFDCLLPDDEEEILLSNGKHVWTDTFINDGECYLDGGDDIDDGMAWMPLPKPYKGGDEYEKCVEQMEHDIMYEHTYNQDDGSMQRR